MKNQHPHNQHNISKPHRLIYANKDNSGTSSAEKKEDVDFTSFIDVPDRDPKEDSKLFEYAKVIGQKAANKQLNTDTFKKFAKAFGSSKNRNNKYFQYYAQALANNNFASLPEHGEGTFEVVEAAMGRVDCENDEQKNAQATLERWKNKKEKKIGQAELYEDFKAAGCERRNAEKLTEQIKNESSEIATRMATVSTGASVKGRADEILASVSRLSDEIDIPKSTLDKLRNARKEELRLMQSFNEIHRQLENLTDKDQLKELERELDEIELKLAQLHESVAEHEKEYKAFMTRSLTRFRAKKEIAENLGVRKLKSGMKFQTREGVLEFVDIIFSNVNETSGPESPGVPLVVYKLDGKIIEPHPSHISFLRDINDLNASPALETKEELHDNISYETAHKNLQPGDEFYSQRTQTGFKILNITNKEIVLDRPVTYLFHTEFRNDSPKRQEVRKSTFSFGEFARLIRSKNYLRKNLTTEDISEAVQKNFQTLEKNQNELADTLEGDAKEAFQQTDVSKQLNFTPPEVSEKKTILYINGNSVSKAEITAFKDQEGKITYHTKPLKFQPKDIKTLMSAGIPPRFLDKRQRVQNYDIDGETGRFQKKTTRITPWQLIEMAKRGDVIDYPESLAAFSDDNVIDATDKFGRKPIPTEGVIKAANDDMPTTAAANDDMEITLNRDAQKKRAFSTLAPGEKEPSTDSTVEEEPLVSNINGSAVKTPPPERTFGDVSVPYEEAVKVGAMEVEEESYLSTLWGKTRFFSMSDFWAMGKTMWEYYDRRFTRRQKEKYSSVGKELPWFAPEMQRINQSAENEEVNSFKETLDQFGVLQIQERLRVTKNRDELKAAFIVLTEKGQLRWDDIQLWENVNRFVATELRIPIPKNRDPNTMLSDDPKNPHYEMTGLDFMKPALDSLWGEGSFDDWYKKNKSSYESGTKGVAEEGKELEGVDGGHTRRLAGLLAAHKRGEYVDPQRYEGLILHSIDAGKSDMASKLFYMIMGVADVNSQGRTIMPFDRIAHINSTYLARFPILEYICGKVPRPPDFTKSSKLTLDDYKKWAEVFTGGDPKIVYPGKSVSDFLWNNVISSDANRRRINKAMRNGEKIDHDDFYAYLPPATEEVVTDATRAQYGGGKKFLTLEGYKNVFPGFSQLMKTFSNQGNAKRLSEAVISWVRYESIVMDRYEKGSADFQRLSTSAILDSGCVVDPDHTPRQFMTEINGIVSQVVSAYEGTPEGNELKRIYDLSRTEVPNEKTPEGRAKQDEVNIALKKFSDTFERAIKSDGGEKLLSIFQSNAPNMIGMPYSSALERDIAKREAGEKSGETKK